MNLGREDGTDDQAFSMTALALRLADQRNSVSQLHGRVSRKMWHRLWPEVQEDEVPISNVTNGIHVPTWVRPRTGSPLREVFRPGLGEKTR